MRPPCGPRDQRDQDLVGAGAAVSLSAAGRRGAGMNPDDDELVEIIIYCGGAQPGDEQLASTVHCMNGEIIGWLEQHEQRNRCRGFCDPGFCSLSVTSSPLEKAAPI